jgi:DNA-binding CsgD family transcriptional regulator
MTRREQELWAIAEEILTVKQLTVLRHWLDGHSIRHIAITLGLAEATVRGHRDRALQLMKPYLRKDVA